MAVDERGTKIQDRVTAELVECVPEPEVSTPFINLPDPMTPTQESADATVEQTGADPPPKGRPSWPIL